MCLYAPRAAFRFGGAQFVCDVRGHIPQSYLTLIFCLLLALRSVGTSGGLWLEVVMEHLWHVQHVRTVSAASPPPAEAPQRYPRRTGHKEKVAKLAAWLEWERG